MVFSEIVFLSVFLPITFILYYLPIPFKGQAGLKYRNAVLVIASLIFYAFGEPVYVFLMIGSVLINYIFGLLLSCHGDITTDNISSPADKDPSSVKKEKGANVRKAWLVLSVIVNVGILAVFKYTGFFLTTINSAFDLSLPVPDIKLPIGISFFTFQAMSYVIDVYRDGCTYQKNFFKLLLYISFFPQLIAGPIVRYHDIDFQLTNRGLGKLSDDLADKSGCKNGIASSEQITAGLMRFSKGLAKKVILANTMGYIADKVYALDITQYGSGVAWMGAICYVFQIFYDFSGYSDMAIGLAKVFGFEFRENFDHPYSSLSIKEFWRRWHISLSSWFKEYVYIPLGGNRKGRIRTELNKLIVFFLTGFWHGANWTFIVWGLFHGFFLILEDSIAYIRSEDTKKRKPGMIRMVLSNLYVWFVVIIGFVFFRSDSLGYAGQMLKQMFTGFSPAVGGRVSLGVVLEQMNPYNILIFLIAILFSYPVTEKIVEKFKSDKTKESQKQNKWWEPCLMLGSLILIAVSILCLASAAYNPFIYFRF
ncbi:alginate O-acetyltransferase complex protein AlgI [Lachnospiraceae bacterium NE2001]|nr:alginate O-acetyltransferase complex protein AlgI [Lachnospiraceae bacterium NE2001]